MEEEKANYIIMTVNQRIIKIFLVLILSPLYSIIQAFNFLLMLFLGLSQNFLIILTARKNLKLATLIINIQIRIFDFTLYFFFLDNLNKLSENRKIDTYAKLDEITNRFNVFLRLVGFPVYLFTIIFYKIAQITYWLFLLIEFSFKGQPSKFSRKIIYSLYDNFNFSIYLCGIREKPIKAQWLDNWLPALLFIYFTNYILLFGFNTPFNGQTNSFSVVRIILNLVFYIFIFLLLFPEFLKFPSTLHNNSKSSTRRYIGLSKPIKPTQTMILALLSTVFLLILIYGSHLVIFYDLSDIAIGKETVLPNVAKALFAGVAEEICYRGIVIVVLSKRFTISKSILFSSILFGLSHLLFPIPYFDYEILAQAIFTTISGIFLATFLFCQDPY